MMLAVARAELRYQLRALRTPVTFAVFFGIAFLMTANAEEFERIAPGGTVLANAPFAITSLLIKLSLAAVFAVPAFLADAALRDRVHGFDGILFATPISQGDYLGGRFLGALAALMVAVSGGALGHLLGGFWPWADTELLGPVRLDHYLAVFLGIQVPTLVALSAIVFMVAVVSRSRLQTYVATLALLVLYLMTGSMDSFPPLLDPFLFEVFDAKTRYWTASERNAQLLPWAGDVLVSRLLWLGIAGALLALTYRLFSFRAPVRRVASKKKARHQDSVPPVDLGERGTPIWGPASPWRQFVARTRFEMKAVLRSAPFVVVMALAFLLLMVELMSREVMYGVQAHPVTRLMLPDVFPVTLAVMAVLVFYSADLVWRERSHGIHQIVDALPTPSGVLVASKVTALVAVVACIYGLGVVAGVALQVSAGTAPVDWGLFVERGFFFPLLPFVCLAVLTCFFQVLSASRYLGMLAFALFLGAIILSRDAYDLEHPLASFVFPAIPAPLSDMNGTGRFMEMGYWLVAYWMAIAGLLLVLTYLLFPRGTLQPLRYRMRRLRALRSRGFAIPSVLLVLCLFGTAGFVFYNTNVLNDYRSVSEVEALRVDYERRFRPFESLPMPRITEVRMEVDLFPDEQRLSVRSTHGLENTTDQDLSTVHVVFPPGLEGERVALEGGVGELLDDRFAAYYAFELERPMAPLERRTLEFEARIEHRGFPHRSPDTRLVRNGTFLTNSRLAPTIGFEDDYLIEDPRVREEHGLPTLPKRARLEDVHQHHNNVTRSDSDFIRFEATVSTLADQTAVTLGRLQREWVEDGRRFFHYELDTPTRNLFPILSGEYLVARDRWRGGRPRGPLPPEARVQRRADARGDARQPRPLQRALWPLSLRPRSDRRVSGLPPLRPGPRRHDPLLRGVGLRGGRPPRRHRHAVLRHRPRDGPHVVGARGDRRQRPGGWVRPRDVGPVLGAALDGTEVRREPDSTLSEVRARPLPRRPGRRPRG